MVEDLQEKSGVRHSLMLQQVQAETWRQRLLLPREQRNGQQARHTADVLASRVIAWSGTPKPTALRHAAAEAILVGLWSMLEAGGLDAVPA